MWTVIVFRKGQFDYSKPSMFARINRAKQLAVPYKDRFGRNNKCNGYDRLMLHTNDVN